MRSYFWSDSCDTNHWLDVCRPFIVINHIIIVHLDPVSPNHSNIPYTGKLLPLPLKDKPAADLNSRR